MEPIGEQYLQPEIGLKGLVPSSVQDLEKMALEKGILFYLRFRLERIRYGVWLWSLREVAILKHLTVNYEKIPKGTPSRVIVYPFSKFVKLKSLLLKIDSKLQSKLY